MKTKEEILKMSKDEINDYMWSDDLDKNCNCENCTNCEHCKDSINLFNCFRCISSSNLCNCNRCINCDVCNDCTSCYACRNAEGLKYAICNVELTKEEYYKKLKELRNET